MGEPPAAVPALPEPPVAPEPPPPRLVPAAPPDPAEEEVSEDEEEHAANATAEINQPPKDAFMRTNGFGARGGLLS